MGELMVPETDDHVGAPAHAGMHRVVSEQQAECRVVRRCRHAPDDVAGVDVLEAERRAALFEVRQ